MKSSKLLLLAVAASVAGVVWVHSLLAADPVGVRAARRVSGSTESGFTRRAAPAPKTSTSPARPRQHRAPAASPGRVIRGRVHSGREPVPFAFVQAKVGGKLVAQDRTDRKGEFVLKGAPTGRFDLEIRHHAHPPLRMAGVGPGRTDEIYRLEPGNGIAGRVTSGGSPVSNAFVQVWLDGKRLRRLVTDPKGAFRLPRMQRGFVEVQVGGSARGHQAGKRVAVQSGDRRIRLTVRPGFAIAGFFSEPAERGSWLEVVDATGGIVLRKLMRKGQGRFEVKGLCSGQYIVRLYRKNRVMAERSVRTGTLDLGL